jgi:hypothetical protein
LRTGAYLGLTTHTILTIHRIFTTGAYLGLNFGEVAIDWGDDQDGDGGQAGDQATGIHTMTNPIKRNAAISVRILGFDESTAAVKVHRESTYDLDQLGAQGAMITAARARALGAEAEWKCVPLVGDEATVVDWLIGVMLLACGMLGPIIAVPAAGVVWLRAACRRGQLTDPAPKAKAE